MNPSQNVVTIPSQAPIKTGKNIAKDFFGVDLSPQEWLIKETTFGLDPQHIQESLFTLGNGFIGSRGVLEEIPELAMPGTFITGVYDKSGAQVEELVNLPNPINFIIAADGEKLDMRFMENLSHTRYLDMHKGMLMRRTIFRDGKKRRYLYQSLRFFSMDNPHIGVMKVSITLLNGRAELTALDSLDDSVANSGGLIYGCRRHVRMMDVGTKSDVNYYAFRTHTSRIWVAYADHLSVEQGSEHKVLPDRVYDFEMRAGDTVTFTKTFSICTSLQQRVTRIKEETLRLLQEAVSKGFDQTVKEHTKEWKTRWEHADITISGDDVCDRALRFNIYHLLIAGYKGSFPMSIGARALTGQGYRGHVFWDAEIFVLPFYIYTDPIIAKNMLLYRYYRLNAARKNAKDKGYKGVLFPWESGSKGDDVTPRYAKDIDGSVMRIDTIDLEQHITADIAYAVYNYYRDTGDMEFMAHQGAEVVFECARFWASRVVFNASRKRYEIVRVMGPDEFHVDVKNNAFTNIMAGWNMEYAHQLYHRLKDERPEELEKLVSDLKLGQGEIDTWKEMSAKMYIAVSSKGIIEQFDGYFKKKETLAKNYSKRFMPEAPSHYSYSDFNKTQFIKQADTLLLFQLLPERFLEEGFKRRNYLYYIARTLHQSSLSHSTHALLASRLGDCYRAYALFLFAAQVDLKNFHNNTDGGMHMANAGGVWQAAVFGFAGVSFSQDVIKINPHVPAHWRQMEFKLFWRKSFIKFRVSNSEVELTCYPIGSEQKNISGEIFGEKYTIEPFKPFSVRRKARVRRMKRVRDIVRKEKFIYAHENAPVRRRRHLLIQHQVSSMPILGNDNELRGIVSEQDILRVTDADLSKLKAKDIMKRSVEYVKEDDHVEIAIRMFTERPFRILPVVKGRTVVGIISRQDVLSACVGEYY